MNDIDARAVPALGGYYGEYKIFSRSTWIRLREQGGDAIFDSDYEAEAKAWRAAKAEAFGRIRAETDIPTSTCTSDPRAEAEKFFKPKLAGSA